MSRACAYLVLVGFACSVGSPAMGDRYVAAQQVAVKDKEAKKKPRKRPLRVVVPSRRFATIQSAVDALPSGSTIRLTNRLYTESVTVARKVIHIVGPSSRSPAALQSDDPESAIITFGPGGGGAIKNLDLQRGAAGIAGVTRLYPDEPQELPGKISVQGCRIRGAKVGVYGRFSSLSIRTVTIQDMEWYALYMLGAETVEIFNAWISDSGNAGIVIFNWDAPGTIHIADSSCYFNAGGGIVVVGDAKPVEIERCECVSNGLAGILLLDVGVVNVDDCYVGSTYVGEAPEKTGVADGLFVTGGSSIPWVEVTNSAFVDNERAGIFFLSADGMVRGCDSSFNEYGIVLEGSPVPDDADLDIDFTDNREGDVYRAGELDIPNESMWTEPMDPLDLGD